MTAVLLEQYSCPLFIRGIIRCGKPFASFATIPLDQAAVKPLLGVYQFDKVKRTVTLADGKLWVQREGGPMSEAFAAGNDRFHYGADELSWFEMRRDAAGKPVMAMHGNGDDEAKIGTYAGPPPVATAAVAVPAALLATYAGSYSTPIGKAKVALAGDALTVQLAGQPPFLLKATGQSDFTVDQVGAKVRFVSVGGKVTAMEILQGGRTLPGTRD